MKHVHVGRATTAFRGRLRAFLLTVLAVSLTWPAVAAFAADESNDYVDLPIQSYADMVVDSAHGQVFVSSYSGSQIVVVHLDGSGVDVIPGMFGAVDMSMTPDGQTVYAALRNGDSLAEIDTTTLAARRIPTGAGSCPTQVAAVAGYVWFVAATDGSCPTSPTTIERLDPVTDTITTDVIPRWLREPALRLIPGTTKLLIAEAVSSSPWIGVFDVASGSPEPVASTEDGPPMDASLRMTTSGQHFFMSSSLRFYRTSDFSADGVTTAPGTLGRRSAVSDDDVVVVGRSDAGVMDVLNRLSDTEANQISFGPGDTGDVIGLEMAGDRLFVVTQKYSYTGDSDDRLYQIERPAEPGPTLTVEVPAKSEVGRPTPVTGVLANEGSPIADAELTVRQYGVEQPLGTATTDADGRYSFDVVPQTLDKTIVSVSYPGSGTTKAAGGHATLNVVRRSVSLTLTGPGSVFPDEPVPLDGALMDGNEPMPGVSLDLKRRCTSRLSSWVPIETVVTDASGRFAASSEVDRSSTCTTYEFGALFNGDDLRMPTLATTTVEAKWVFPAFEFTSPGTVYAGDQVDIAGTLKSQDGPMPGKEVRIRVFTPDGTRDLGTLTTDDNGAFALTDVPTVAGEHYYEASTMGDARTWSASRQLLVPVYINPSEISLTGPAASALDKPTVLTGSLTSRGKAVSGVDVVVSRTDNFRGTETLPPVVTAADGSFVIRDAPPAGGVVSYAASYPGSVAREAASTSWKVDVARPARTLVLRANRTVYDQEEIARLTVDLTTDSSRAVQVFAQEAGQARTLMFSGDVPETGLTLQHRMTRNTTFTARIAADGRALGATSTASPTVRPTLTTGAIGAYRTSGGYKIFRPKTNPRFTATYAPQRDQGCIAFQVQRRFPTAWHRVARTACAVIGDNSTATWMLRAQDANMPYRVRSQFRGDDLNAGTTGPWLYFKFVRPPP